MDLQIQNLQIISNNCILKCKGKEKSKIDLKYLGWVDGGGSSNGSSERNSRKKLMLIGALAASLLELLKLQQESILLYLNETTEAREEEKKKNQSYVCKEKESPMFRDLILSSFNFVKTADSNFLFVCLFILLDHTMWLAGS